MKKIISIILSLVMILSFTACGTKAEAGWKEQYDLGVKYVNEAKYEEAILAFTKALEIDPKQAATYISIAEIYVSQDDSLRAQNILDLGYANIENNYDIEQAYIDLNLYKPSKVIRYDIEESDGYLIDSYNENGCIIYSVKYNSDGSMVYFTEFNGSGMQVKSIHYNADGTISSIFEFNEDGTHISTQYELDGRYSVSEHNMNGYPTKYTYYNADGSIEEYGFWEYTSDNKIIRNIRCWPDGDRLVNEYDYMVNEYDDNERFWRVIRQISYEPNGDYTVVELDENGNKISQKSYNAYGTLIH